MFTCIPFVYLVVLISTIITDTHIRCLTHVRISGQKNGNSNSRIFFLLAVAHSQTRLNIDGRTQSHLCLIPALITQRISFTSPGHQLVYQSNSLLFTPFSRHFHPLSWVAHMSLASLLARTDYTHSHWVSHPYSHLLDPYLYLISVPRFAPVLALALKSLLTIALCSRSQ